VRWRELRGAVAAVCMATLLAVTDGAAASPEVPVAPGAEMLAAIEAQLEAVGRTEALLDTRTSVRAAELERRVRSAYKLLRAGWAPLWVEADERGATARRVAAIRRIVRRDLDELAQLRAEIDAARAARARLERRRGDATAAVAPQTLARPVPGAIVRSFGPYRHRDTGATLSRRGVELATRPGAEVVAAAAGEVRFAGPVRGLGLVVVVAGGGELWTVTGGLDRVDVTRGDRVARGAPVGRAAGPRVHFEARLGDSGGHPIDPTPLFAP
jgi:murein hydrolase activator